MYLLSFQSLKIEVFMAKVEVFGAKVMSVEVPVTCFVRGRDSGVVTLAGVKLMLCNKYCLAMRMDRTGLGLFMDQHCVSSSRGQSV